MFDFTFVSVENNKLLFKTPNFDISKAAGSASEKTFKIMVIKKHIYWITFLSQVEWMQIL